MHKCKNLISQTSFLFLRIKYEPLCLVLTPVEILNSRQFLSQFETMKTISEASEKNTK